MQAVHEHVLHELVRGRGGTLLVELDHVDDVDAELFEQLELAGQTGEQLRRGLRANDERRMLVEGDHGRGHAAFGGASLHLADHGLVADVDTVERAGGENGRLDRFGVGVMDDLHECSSGAGSVGFVGSTSTTEGLAVPLRCVSYTASSAPDSSRTGYGPERAPPSTSTGRIRP